MAARERAQYAATLKQLKLDSPPPLPQNKFMIFANEKRLSIAKDQPGLSLGELSASIGETWRSLDPETREQYSIKAAEAKKKYENDMKAYLEQMSGSNQVE